MHHVRKHLRHFALSTGGRQRSLKRGERKMAPMAYVINLLYTGCNRYIKYLLYMSYISNRNVRQLRCYSSALLFTLIGMKTKL